MIPVISPATQYQMVGGAKYGANLLFPHILGCYPPDSVKHLVPESVSLVEAECPKLKPSNNLRVHFEKPETGHKQGTPVKWPLNFFLSCNKSSKSSYKMAA